MLSPQVTSFFHEPTNTVTYLVCEPGSPYCVLIDPVMDYDSASGQLSHQFADNIVSHVVENDLVISWILETHAHADHITAAPYLQKKFGSQVAIGKYITEVQSVFSQIFNLEAGFAKDGRQFDRLLSEGDVLEAGPLRIEVIHTPGHTPACVSYLIGDAVFVGDTLFMPDYGTARCDFPKGDAATLYRSIQKLLALPEDTRMFVGHDYRSPTRDAFAWQTTVGEQKHRNVHVHEGVSEQAFVSMREQRDATLAVPKLLYPSVQLNIRGGHLPPAEGDNQFFIRIPLRMASE